MRQTLNGMRKRGSEDRGFTMIELLVVVVIIGVLVAIAVPVYLNYRKGAANKSAASDVRGAITAVEQYYTDNGNAYPTGTLTSEEGKALTLTAAAEGTEQKITVSPGNTLGYRDTTTAGVASYRLCARNKDGEQVYVYNSTAGGSVAKAPSTVTTVAACLGA
jgi:type IV pilus assembly protein PilA